MRPLSFVSLALITFLTTASVHATPLKCSEIFADGDQNETFAKKMDSPAPNADDLLFVTYKSNAIDLSKYKGQTYLATMKKVIKPALDKVAKSGFKVAPKESFLNIFDNVVDDKVRRNVLKAVGSRDNLAKIADGLAGQTVTYDNLPAKIDALHLPGVNKWNASTFIELVSGGGAVVDLGNGVRTYNDGYLTGEGDKDEMSGRTFGGTRPNDVSDKDLLLAIQAYIKAHPDETGAFYKSYLEILTNSDSSGLKKLSDDGCNLMGEDCGVYTAEQDRHLMANLTSHAWDVALLEVTLLSALPAGQSKVMVMFNGKLVDKMPKQAPGGQPRTQLIDADLSGYWQFSPNAGPNANRSGINETKRDFRALGKMITTYMNNKFPDMVKDVEKHFPHGGSGNVFQDLSEYLVNAQTPDTILDAEGLATDFANFLVKVQAEAKAITAAQIAAQGGDTTGKVSTAAGAGAPAVHPRAPRAASASGH